jgi:regulator of sigma E protease
MNNWFLLAAIPVFGLLIIVHEFGHFITAKWAGIRVDEFALGFPPRLFGFKRGETTYSINLLPIGGYVRMPGENGETTDEQGNFDPRSFAAKPASKRLIVLLAGVTMNVILALVLLTAAEAIGSPNPYALVGDVQAGSPAAAAGLRSGDRILSVNGQSVQYFTDFRNAVSAVTDTTPQDTKTVPITVVVQHKGESQPVTVTVQAIAHPHAAAGQGPFGVTADYAGAPWVRAPLWKAPLLGVQDMGAIIVATVQFVGMLIHGVLPWNQTISGPVGIVKQTGQEASAIPVAGPAPLLFFTALISLNLAFVNALPIPALDGGRVVFVLIEMLRRGKRISPEREGLVNLIGMGLLLLLILVVTINDIGNLGH